MIRAELELGVPYHERQTESGGIEVCLENYLSIVRRVVDREMWRGVSPWVDRSDLEDVAQLALVKARAEYDGCCPFAAFAYREVRTAVLGELRKLRVRHRGRTEMPQDDTRQPDSGRRRNVYPALAALPPRQFRAVMLYFWGGMTQAAISEEMGISVGRVSQLLGAAQKNLRASLKNGDIQSRGQVENEKCSKNFNVPLKNGDSQARI